MLGRAFTSATREETASASSLVRWRRDMAGTDNGEFDVRALQRVGDFTNDRLSGKSGASCSKDMWARHRRGCWN